MARVSQDRVELYIAVNGKEIKNTLKDIRKEYRDTIKARNQATVGSEEFNRLTKEAEQLKKTLAEQRIQITGTAKATGLLRAGMRQVGAAIKAAMAPLFALTIIGEIIQLTRAQIDAANEASDVAENINRVTGLTGESLTEATAQASAFGKAFEVDVAKGIDAANSAANAFIQEGETVGDSFLRIQEGVANGLLAVGDKGDEFLSQVEEYSGKARLAGLEAEEFFSVIATGINKGVPTDKLIDSVGEFNTRIKTLTDGQRKSLEQTLGKGFTETLVSSIEDGSMASADAVEQVATKIEELGVDSAASQLILSDLFGGAGEDAAVFVTALQDLNKTTSDLIDNNNIYIQRKQEIFALEKEAAEATAELGLQLEDTGQFFTKVGIQIRTFVTRAIANLIEYFTFLPERIDIAKIQFRLWINDGIKGLENLMRRFSPIIQIYEKLSGNTFELPKLEVDESDLIQAEEGLQMAINSRREQLKELQRVRDLEAVKGAAKAEEFVQAKLEEKKLEIIRIAKQAGLEIETDMEQRIAEARLGIFLDAQDQMEEAEAARREASFQLRQAQVEENLADITKAYEVGQQVINGIFAFGESLATKRFNKSISELEKNKERELKLAGDSEEKKQEIEARYTKEKEKLELKQRKRQKRNQLIQGSVDLAGAVLKALGSPPIVPNLPAAALTGTLGGLQLATMSQAEFFADGGFTAVNIGSFKNGGWIDRPSFGVIGEAGREWVASNGMVNHPTYGPMIQHLDGVQKAKAFVDGGFTAAEPSDTAVTLSGANEATEEMVVLLRQLIVVTKSQKHIMIVTEKNAQDIKELQDQVATRRADTALG